MKTMIKILVIAFLLAGCATRYPVVEVDGEGPWTIDLNVYMDGYYTHLGDQISGSGPERMEFPGAQHVSVHTYASEYTSPVSVSIIERAGDKETVVDTGHMVPRDNRYASSYSSDRIYWWFSRTHYDLNWNEELIID